VKLPKAVFSVIWEEKQKKTGYMKHQFRCEHYHDPDQSLHILVDEDHSASFKQGSFRFKNLHIFLDEDHSASYLARIIQLHSLHIFLDKDHSIDTILGNIECHHKIDFHRMNILVDRNRRHWSVKPRFTSPPLLLIAIFYSSSKQSTRC
jgi:hypothetical protein